MTYTQYHAIHESEPAYAYNVTTTDLQSTIGTDLNAEYACRISLKIVRL